MGGSSNYFVTPSLSRAVPKMVGKYLHIAVTYMYASQFFLSLSMHMLNQELNIYIFYIIVDITNE